MLRIYYAHWGQSVTDGSTVTKWAVNFKQRFCNTLAVKHKYSNSLPINEARNYKRRRQQKLNIHTNTLRKSPSSEFSLKSFSLTDLSIGGGLANATPTYYSSTQFIFASFPPTKMTPITVSSIHYDEELNCWFFLHHQYF